MQDVDINTQGARYRHKHINHWRHIDSLKRIQLCFFFCLYVNACMTGGAISCAVEQAALRFCFENLAAARDATLNRFTI